MNIDEHLAIMHQQNYTYTDVFRRNIEDLLEQLKKSETTRTISISPAMAYRHEYNLYGLLNELNIPMSLHWVTMRLNNIINPRANCSHIRTLKVPDENVINEISVYLKTSKFNW